MSSLIGEFNGSILAFLGFIFTLIALVISLICIWRAEKQLKTFLILSTLAVGTRGARQILEILGLNQSVSWNHILIGFDLTLSLLFMLAAIEMRRIIQVVTKERKGR